MSLESNGPTFSLRLLEYGSALERVVNALRRRGHTLRAIQYTRGDETGIAHVTMTVCVGRGRPDRLEVELGRLHCVLEVRESSIA